jgi:agmatine deiminase
MKNLYLASILLILPLLLGAQGNTDIPPYRLGHWLSPEEMLRKGESGKNFVETAPPTGPVRNIAEFDRMQGVLVRYPFGVPIALIKEMAKDVMVTTIVLNSSQQTTVTQQYQNAGVNLDHCNFLLAPSDSYWTRDYGPWFESDSLNHIGIIDFPYNRPRPNDDEIPKLIAAMLGIPWFGMNITHTGGNYMTDGMGISSSTDLVWTENSTQTHDSIAGKMHKYLGINNYMVVPDPNGTYIDHIDCWGKYLAPDKILIRKVLPSHPQYAEIEAMAAFYASQVCSYGYPYRVYRVMTPQDQPYSNSLILNNKVLIPKMNSTWDDSAVAAYQAAMPGYQVLNFVGLPAPDSWVSTDALHCRAIGIADLGQLYMRHVPVSGNQPAEYNYPLTASLIACSDSAIYSDSVLIWYRVNGGPFIMKHMVLDSGNRYTGFIPHQAGGSTVEYYLYAADHSGRNTTQPIMAAADPFIFHVISTDIEAVPDTLWFRTFQDCTDGKITTLHNYTSGAIDVTAIETAGIPIGGGAAMWVIDPVPPSSFTMNPGDAIDLRVVFLLPVGRSFNGYVIDTLHYTTTLGVHNVILMLNDSLLTGTGNRLDFSARQGMINYPNPFTGNTTIALSGIAASPARIEIFDVRGIRVRMLLDGELRGKSVVWNSKDDFGNTVAPGIYICRFTASDRVLTCRMNLVR